MGPSVPNFTLIGDGGGHSSPRNSNICQSCAVLATFSPFSKSSRIYWSRWNMVRNQRLSIYSRRPNFSYNRRTVKGTGPLKHYKFCQNVGLLAGFPLSGDRKNQYGRNSASTVSLLYWTLVVDGGTQTPEFQSLVNVAVFRWDHRFPEAWE